MLYLLNSKTNITNQRTKIKTNLSSYRRFTHNITRTPSSQFSPRYFPLVVLARTAPPESFFLTFSVYFSSRVSFKYNKEHMGLRHVADGYSKESSSSRYKAMQTRIYVKVVGLVLGLPLRYPHVPAIQ